MWIGLAITLLLHLLFVSITWWEMQPQAFLETVPERRGDALQVRLIPRPKAEVPSAPPLETPPPPPPPAPRPAPVVHEAPAKNAMSVSLPASSSSTAAHPQLFDTNGRPLLPAANPSPAPTPDYVARGVDGDTKVMQHSSPVKYQATRFDKDWDRGEDVVDSALRKVVEKATVKHTFHVAPGVRIHCTVALFVGGCGGDPPPPPSAKDGDERLNMAPSSLLAPSPNPPKPPSEAECIAIYRDGKPLPHGCPVDTPNRSVDAELRDREAKHQGNPP